MTTISRLPLLLVAIAFGIQPGLAQDFQLDDPLGLNQFGIEKDVDVTTELVAGKLEAGKIAYLRVTASLPLNHYIYSTNPDLTGSTSIELSETPGLEPIDAGFKPDREPKRVEDEVMGQLEKFYDEVTWTKRFRIVDPSTAAVTGELNGQFCTAGKDGQGANCTPIRPAKKVKASLTVDESIADETTGGPVYTIESKPVRGEDKTPDPLSLGFSISPEDAKVGDEVTVSVQVTLDKGWHVFSQAQGADSVGTPTVLKVSEVAGLEAVEPAFKPDHEPESVDLLGDGNPQSLFHDSVTWSRRFKVTDASFGVRGEIKYQVCDEGTCLPPNPVQFALGDQLVAYTKLAAPAEAVQPAASGGVTSPPTGMIDRLYQYLAGFGLKGFLVLAFLGGLILNIMPCVLPVLAIKVLSFVKQAGENKSRIFVLNVAYAGGVIAVFLVLAGLAVFLKMGWGSLFQSPLFNLVMAGVIFAMGLSLLGVFEIPIPGIGGGDSKEGPSGAFLTGIFATILATPCSGPFLGGTFAWSVKQPTHVTFLVWAVMGLGMASPYLLFAVSPGAVKLLPKPGMWMVRFKEFCGFVLMFTTVYFMTLLEDRLVVPFLLAMVALGMALWMIGSLYQHNSTRTRKGVIRGLAAVVFGLGIAAAMFFTPAALPAGEAGELVVVDDGKTLPWKAFSEKKLLELVAEKKTVMVDFTADWCPSCKTNELIALNTPETLGLVKEHDIVPLLADWTRSNADIEKYLAKYESISIPLTVIIPNGDLENPVILRDSFTQGTLSDAIKRATGS